MKKTIIILIGLLILSFTPEKKYKLEFNEQQLNALWNCIDNSTASHNDVKVIQALIQSQIKGQAQQSTDSTKLKR